MSLRLRELALTLEEDETLLLTRLAEQLSLAPAAIIALRVVRRGIDARRKSRILQVYTVEFEVADEAQLLAQQVDNPRLERVEPVAAPEFLPLRTPCRVLVVGMGPAGLFSALQLARSGAQVTLIERGQPVEERVRDVERFWTDGLLDPESNVQFGEGGAGTFSDGKLTTRLNHPLTSFILQTLVDCGAPPEILTQAKPHVGTDRLRLVLIHLRRMLQELGVELRYRTRLDGLVLKDGRVKAGRCGEDEIPCAALVLALGHSARDTYAMLQETGVALETKAFAIGVRVEHPSALINTIQYGVASHPRLPAADYALAWNDPESGRGVYSFCMCPGGEVVIASSEAGGLVVNGMSRRERSSAFSNSALVVAVRPEDFDGRDPLAGVRFQQHWEAAAFRLGGNDYHAPAQNLVAFLGRGSGPVTASARPGVRAADLTQALPTFVSAGLRRALPHFEQRMRGFITSEATLIGVETRTSAPLRILRNAEGESLSHPGLYPAGEGAGYAGGIMSAALDGLRTAQQVIDNFQQRSTR